MTAVVLAAKTENRDFFYDIARLLENHFETIRAYDRILSLKKSNPAFILCDIQGFDTIKAEKAVIICKDVLPISHRLLEVEQAVVVVDSSNQQLPQSVADTGLPAITCGLGSRDTMTLSSIGEDSAVIGIQRAIENFDGTRTDPQEFPLVFAKPIDPFALMAAAAIFILSGNSHLLTGKM